MLLDATAVLLGVGLAVAGFIVVIVVSATVLRLIGFVLGDGEATSVDEEPDDGASSVDEQPDEGADPAGEGTGPETGDAADHGASEAGDAEPHGAPDPG